MRNNFLTLFFLIITLHSLPILAQQSPSTNSTRHLDNTHWGLCVQDIETGQIVVSRNADLLFTPASTMKVVTTASALSILGADKTFETEVATTGNITPEGVLQGDIYIIGSGDPSIGSKNIKDRPRDLFFTSAVEAIREKGIVSVEGSVVALLGKIDQEPVNPNWMLTDMGNYYGAASSDLCVFDNTYSVTVYKDKRKMVTDPYIPYIDLVPMYESSARKGSDSLHITGPIREYRREIHGLFPSKFTRTTIRGDIPRPPHFVAYTLDKYLKLEGISVSGEPAEMPQTDAKEYSVIYTYHSPTLLELARITNFVSHNLYAEQLLLAVAKSNPLPLAGHNMWQRGVSAEANYWRTRGLSFKETDILDGSGLAPSNKFSPRFMTNLLGKMYRGPLSEAFYSTLPVVGEDGTVSSFLKNSALHGKARLKSGSLRKVVTYAGYVEHNGKMYAVAIMVNNHQSTYWNTRKAVERVLLDVFR